MSKGTLIQIKSRAGRIQGAPNELKQRGEEEQRKAIETRIKELLGEQRFAQLQQAEAMRQAAEQARWEADAEPHARKR